MVSVIIPTYNEEKYIEKCLLSIVNNDFPKDKLEVLVIDGGSQDKTREIIFYFCKKYPFIKFLNNPFRTQVVAFNMGVRESKGDVIIIISSHAEYPKDYISKLAGWLKDAKADVVGGMWKIKPGSNTLVARSISEALCSSFGIGNIKYRLGTEKPTYVDTVPYGAYKRSILNSVGLFDEHFDFAGEDAEINFRISRNGGKILLVPDVYSVYYARPTLSKLGRQYFNYGLSKPLIFEKHKALPSWRHFVPPAFVGSLIISLVLSVIYRPFLWLFLFILGSYIIANLAFSLKIFLKKGFRFFFVLPLVFATLHLSYGIGYLKGIWDFIILKRHKKKKIEHMPRTR